ncbi:MAG: hypothetical protein WCP33_04480, partial [Deltaproteobacteria bacterium]
QQGLESSEAEGTFPAEAGKKRKRRRRKKKHAGESAVATVSTDTPPTMAVSESLKESVVEKMEILDTETPNKRRRQNKQKSGKIEKTVSEISESVTETIASPITDPGVRSKTKPKSKAKLVDAEMIPEESKPTKPAKTKKSADTIQSEVVSAPVKAVVKKPRRTPARKVVQASPEIVE